MATQAPRMQKNFFCNLLLGRLDCQEITCDVPRAAKGRSVQVREVKHRFAKL